MGLSQDCRDCLLRRQKEQMKRQNCEKKKESYLRKVQQLIDTAEEKDTAPVVLEKIGRLHQEYFDTAYSFEALKESYNEIMLEKEAGIRQKIETSKDPLKAAILYARVGNYIDFGALGSVDDQKLEQLLERALQEELDPVEYEAFHKEIETADRVVYLPDNCGEVVLDKLLMEQILKTNPNCKLTAIVRGTPVLNDVTLKDAKMVGLLPLAHVIGNGTGVAGTSLSHINKEAKQAMESADLIISKGQGNFETLNHCGLNIYYLFLCKCEWFVKRFGLVQYEGVFLRDQKLR